VEQQRPAVKKIGAQYYNGFKFFPAFTCDQPIFPRDNKKITDVEAIRQKIATKNLKKREKKKTPQVKVFPGILFLMLHEETRPAKRSANKRIG
jgi:hypothetical protein